MRLRRLLLGVGLLGACASWQHPQTPTRLPASFSDVELRGSMLDAAVSRLGAGGENRPVAAPPRGSGVGGGIIVPENSGAPRFIVAADSLLFRNGPDALEIATTDFIAVDEVHGPRTPHIVWVRLRYRDGTEERELFVRRYSTRDQSGIRRALEAAMPRRELERQPELTFSR